MAALKTKNEVPLLLETLKKILGCLNFDIWAPLLLGKHAEAVIEADVGYEIACTRVLLVSGWGGSLQLGETLQLFGINKLRQAILFREPENLLVSGCIRLEDHLDFLARRGLWGRRWLHGWNRAYLCILLPGLVGEAIVHRRHLRLHLPEHIIFLKLLSLCHSLPVLWPLWSNCLLCFYLALAQLCLQCLVLLLQVDVLV